jgi:hypothetical protein
MESSNACKYLVLKWKDGWREVIKIPYETEDLLRYYVIRRMEEEGRLVLKKEEYPELVLIDRKPQSLNQVMVYDGEGKAYSLMPKNSERIGDKIELVYEKTESKEFIAEVMWQVKNFLQNREVTPNDVLSLSEKERTKLLEEMRRSIHIYASKDNNDCLNFLKLILEHLAKTAKPL